MHLRARDSLPSSTAGLAGGLAHMTTSSAPVDSVRHNLPASLTSFVGRERELADLQARLADARLVTLTGVGGCGKTRLALELARAVLDRYPDGIWLAELAPLEDAELVAHSVAAVLGVRETAGQSTIDALGTRLRARRLMLVLDNCEHLLDACARLVDALLRACPDVHVLTTSREALGITGEIAWRVPSLAVPDPQRRPPVAELQSNQAVRLFTERALAVQPHFSVTEHNAASVTHVCARLDGIPLALELAAARMAALTVDQLAARLDQRFRLLTGGSRTAPPRQQTLRATLDWSYELLSEPERCLLNRLAVFAGGWSLEAAEAVCAREGIEEQDVLDLLSRLVNKSLVIAEEDPEGSERYRMLETVRQYARERLVAAGEATVFHHRHAAYFLALHGSDELRRAIRLLTTQAPLLDHLEREQDNFRAALRWWIESLDAERAIQQAAALYPIWFFRGSLSEGRAWLEEVLALPTAKAAPEVRVRALSMLGDVARRHGEYTLALDAFNALSATQEEIGDERGAAETLARLANLHYLRADYKAAWACLEASQIGARGHADPLLLEDWGFYGGQIALHEGRYDLARSLLREAEEVTTRQRGRVLRTAYISMNLGVVAREQGQHSEAQTCLDRGLHIAGEYGDRALLAHVLEGFSGLASALDQHERAICLGGAAAALRDAIGAPLSPAWRPLVERWLGVSRAALTSEAAATAWHAGQGMSLEQAIEFAQAPWAPSAGRGSGDAPPVPRGDRLTAREREVAALTAQGLSNRQIAEHLVITERTVAAHIEHILDKLSFTSRTQIGVWAVQHDLAGSNPA